MLLQLLRFEVLHQSKQRALPIAALLFFSLGCFLGKAGNAPALVDFNAPFQISYYTGNFSLMSVFIIMFFAVSGAIRDHKHGMEALIYSSPIRKGHFFWSRFIGVFLFSVVGYSLFLPGFLVGLFISDLDTARIAVFQWQSYMWPFLVIIMPNVFICSSLLFSVSLLSKSNVATYAGAILIYILYFIVGIYSNSPMFASSLTASPEQMTVAALADPFAISTFFEHTQFWTPFEKSNKMLSFSGNYVWNRMLWIGFSFIVLGVTYRLFSFRKITQLGKKKASHSIDKGSVIAYRKAEVQINRKTQWRAFGYSVKMEVKDVMQSLPFMAILFTLFAALVFELYARFFEGGAYGENWYPYTNLVIETVIEIVPTLSKILIVFYSGELIWKAKDQKFDSILNATPSLNWVFFFSKLATLVLLPMLLIVTVILVGLAFQLANGFTDIDFTQYLLLFYYHGIPALVFSMLAFFVQNVVKRKYLGMGITGLIILSLASPLSYNLGIEHPMLRIGVMPSITYSNMAGYGIQVRSTTIYALYWVSLGLIFSLISLKFWNRQLIEPRRVGNSIYLQKWKRSEVLAIGIPLIVLMIMGSILHNKLHTDGHYKSNKERLDYSEQYERRFKQYEVLPKLYYAAMKTEVDIYPSDQKYTVSADYQLVNKNRVPVKQVFISETKKLSAISLENAKLIFKDSVFGTYLFEFDQPIPPLQTTRLRYQLSHQSLPFNPDYSIVKSGTYLRHEFFDPVLGYKKDLELSDPQERKKRGLPQAGKKLSEDQLLRPVAENVDISFETVVSTSADQVALAPGTLMREWTKDGRNFYRYKYLEENIPVIAYISARYASRKTSCHGIEVEHYYQPGHDINLPTIEASTCATLAYCIENFGPYPFNHLNVAETTSYFPWSGAAQPGLINMTEDKLYLVDISKNKTSYLVAKQTAGQIAHHWWGMSLKPKRVPGSGFLTFGLTEYTAALVLESLYGKGAIWNLSKSFNERYFRGRTYAAVKEPPLYLERGEKYLMDGKSGLVLLSIHDLIGEEKFNTALRTLLHQSSKDPAYKAHTLDFIDALHQITSLEEQKLINEWMKQIIRYEVAVENVRYKRLPDGQYEIKTSISAKKFKTLPSGKEIAISLDEPLKIGGFDKHPKDIGKADQIPYLKEHRIQGRLTTIKITLDSLPRYISVDPFLTRPDRNYTNNLKALY